MNMGGEKHRKSITHFNSRNVSPDSLLAFSHTHTNLKLHRHSLRVDTLFRENTKEGRDGQGIRDIGLWSLAVQTRSSSMGHKLLWEIRAKGSTTTRLRNTPGKGFKWLQNEMREAELLNLLCKYLTKQ